MVRVRVLKVDDPQALGARLRAARTAAGISQRGLAFPGCTAPYISVIENGRRVPSLQVLNVLAARLGVSADYLATGRESPLSDRVAEGELLLRLGELDQAEQRFRELVGQGSPADRLRSLGGLGVVAVQRGDLPGGIDFLEQAQAIDPERFLRETSLVEALGRSYATRGEYESAVVLFRDAQARARARSDRPTALKHTVLLANTYIDFGDVTRSSEVLGEALSDLVELTDPRLRASVYWSQARLHTIERRHDLAAQFAERALETLRVVEDERTIAFARQLLAYIEIDRGKPEEALELLDSTSATIDRVAEPLERAVFQLERARALTALDRLEEARAVLIEIAPTLSESPRGDGGRYFVQLAELYSQLGDEDDALTMVDEAIDRLSDHRNPHLVQAYRLKGALLERAGQTEQALEALRQALAAQDTAPSSQIERG